MNTRKNHLKLIALITCLVLAALACAIPGVGSSDGSLYRDDFSSTDSNWGIGTDADSSVEYSNDGLQFLVITPFYYTWSNPGVGEEFENIHLEVTVKNTSSDPNATFGLVCHQQLSGDSHYYFAVTTGGAYSITKAALARDDEILSNNGEWGTSDLIPVAAETYQLGADCGNGALTLYVNGQQIASVTDATYTKGEVGLMAWSDEVASGTLFLFDDFVVTPLNK